MDLTAGALQSPGAGRMEAGEELHQVLRERARLLARPEVDDTASDSVELAILRVGGERYALELRHLDEVRTVDRVARVPGAPSVWAGMVAVRGVLYPVMDLARFLGIAAGGASGAVVLVSVGDLSAGLLVDEVPEFASIPRKELHGFVAPGDGAGAVRGITPDLVSILDLETAFADPRVQPIDDQPITGGDP